MPETTYDDMEPAVKSSAKLAAQHRSNAAEWLTLRDERIREAHARGATYHVLASWSGLSRAQVQRICDLSKGRGE